MTVPTARTRRVAILGPMRLELRPLERSLRLGRARADGLRSGAIGRDRRGGAVEHGNRHPRRRTRDGTPPRLRPRRSRRGGRHRGRHRTERRGRRPRRPGARPRPRGRHGAPAISLRRHAAAEGTLATSDGLLVDQDAIADWTRAGLGRRRHGDQRDRGGLRAPALALVEFFRAISDRADDGSIDPAIFGTCRRRTRRRPRCAPPSSASSSSGRGASRSSCASGATRSSPRTPRRRPAVRALERSWAAAGWRDRARSALHSLRGRQHEEDPHDRLQARVDRNPGGSRARGVQHERGRQRGRRLLRGAGRRWLARTDAVSITATVEAIDQATRMVTLRGPEGDPRRGPRRRSRARPDPGEEGRSGRRGVRRCLRGAGREARRGAPGRVHEDRATKTFAEPMRSRRSSIESLTVTSGVTAVDRAKQTVTLRGVDGESTTVSVKDPAQLESVAVGDLVEVTATQALAIAVEAPGADWKTRPRSAPSQRGGDSWTEGSIREILRVARRLSARPTRERRRSMARAHAARQSPRQDLLLVRLKPPSRTARSSARWRASSNAGGGSTACPATDPLAWPAGGSPWISRRSAGTPASADCAREGEPGCAVRSAIEAGDLEPAAHREPSQARARARGHARPPQSPRAPRAARADEAVRPDAAAASGQAPAGRVGLGAHPGNVSPPPADGARAAVRGAVARHG